MILTTMKMTSLSLFGVFLSLHPKVNTKTWQDLSKQFLQKTNGTTIFPKLPCKCMLKAHYTLPSVETESIDSTSREQSTGSDSGNTRSAYATTYCSRAPVNNDVDVSVPAANFVGTLAAPHQTEFVETNRIKRQLNVKGAFRFECFDLWILPHWCVGGLVWRLRSQAAIEYRYPEFRCFVLGFCHCLFAE